MIHFRLKLTWPAALLILVALILWLTSDPDRPARKPQPLRRPPEPRARRRPLVIDQNQEPTAADYDAETQRLDREAADRGQRVYQETARPYEEVIERMNQRNESRQRRAAAR